MATNGTPFWQGVTADDAYAAVVQMETNDARRRLLNGMPLRLVREVADLQHAIYYCHDVATRKQCVDGIMSEFEV